MREIRTSGSMSGSEKPGQGWASEALPKETGSKRIGPTYRTRRLDSTLPNRPRTLMTSPGSQEHPITLLSRTAPA